MQNISYIERSATVALVPEANLLQVKSLIQQTKDETTKGRTQREGYYLRSINDESYLFHYTERRVTAGAHLLNETELKLLSDLVEPLPNAARKGLHFEPMEAIFYEPGLADTPTPDDVMRIAMFTELRPEKEAHYRLLHDNPWPDVIAAIHRAGFRHFSIFLEEIDGRIYLFGWLEYIGDDIAADGAENKKDPASIRWWRETDACQIAPPDAGDGTWGGMDEIEFFTY
jgi:L-rhamnose mutarotase